MDNKENILGNELNGMNNDIYVNQVITRTNL